MFLLKKADVAVKECHYVKFKTEIQCRFLLTIKKYNIWKLEKNSDTNCAVVLSTAVAILGVYSLALARHLIFQICISYITLAIKKSEVPANDKSVKVEIVALLSSKNKIKQKQQRQKTTNLSQNELETLMKMGSCRFAKWVLYTVKRNFPLSKRNFEVQ